MHKRKLLLWSLTAFMAIVLTGCFQGEKSLDDTKMDPPPDAEATDDKDQAEADATADKAEGEKEEDESESQKDQSSETVNRKLFLLDADGMVAPQTIEVPKAEANQVAKQSLEYLVKDGPVSELLPNGFQAVLPAGTEIHELALEDDGTMIVDVSEEFENYQAENELEILQAMTYTLTQYDSVDEMKLRIDGDPQETMPVDGTPIADGYSRANGINLTQSGTVDDMLNSKPVTLYYPSVQGDNNYFVPVTEYIDTDGENGYASTVKALMQGPALDTNLQQVFNRSVDLTNDPELDDGVLEMVFNQELLKDSDEAVVSNDVMETLVRTMTQLESVEAVNVEVEDVETLFNENGDAYTEPVTLKSFGSPEKL